LWGIGEAEIAEAALGNLSFNLLRAEILFPDLTYLVFPGNALVEARSFNEAWAEGGKPFTVYAGLRKWNDASENVTVLSSLENLADVSTRFVTTVDPEEVPSLHESGPLANVKRLYYVLKIFWETEREQLGDYVLIPIANLIRTGEDIAISKQFVPPCLSISASSPLVNLITEIRDQIASRAHQLELYKRERGIHTADFGARDMVYLLALRSLNRYVPLLFHLTEAQRVHPWTVYGLLRQLVGELSSFSEQINTLGEMADGSAFVSIYEHQKLWECFSDVQMLITRLLNEITAGPAYMLQLIYDGAYYASELSSKIFEGHNRFFLVIESEADLQAILRSLGTTAKLSSRESLPILISRALPGIKLNHLASPPQELPKRSNSIYLQIDQNSDQWTDVKKAKNIAMFWDTAPDDLKIELMVVGRK
ncbi:MAG: type VI secretion system baseplate subunit TssK, partial [Desulfobacterales bacterium]